MNLSGSSDHGIFQARILEWVAISFSRGIFPTKGLNPGLLHCRQMLYHLSHQGSSIYIYIYIYSLHNLSFISSTYFRNSKAQHNGKESSLRTHFVRVLIQAKYLELCCITNRELPPRMKDDMKKVKFLENENECNLKTWRIICNIRKLETTQISINWRLDKQNVIGYHHTMAYYPAINKNEVLIHGTTQKNLEEYAMWNKPNTKGHILYDSTYMKCPK